MQNNQLPTKIHVELKDTSIRAKQIIEGGTWQILPITLVIFSVLKLAQVPT